jgi:uncharacterized protein (TIGR02996 family)
VSTDDTYARLLATILADPDATAPRLILADFLHEKGEPRGELIAVQCQLAGLASNDERKRAPLEAREKELLKKHGAAWSPKNGKLRFERGFADMWKTTGKEFAKQAAAVFAREPIRFLDLSQHDASDPLPYGTLDALRRPELAKLRRLQLRRLRLTVGEFAKVTSCPHLANLRELDVSYIPMSMGAVRSLTQQPTFTKLEVLQLVGSKIDARLPGLLAKAPYASTLQSLDLTKSKIGDEGVIALAATKELSGLRSLGLSSCNLGAPAIIAIVESEALANLRKLGLEGHALAQDLRARIEKRFTAFVS